MSMKAYPLQMPEDLHKAVKVMAAQTGKTMSQIIIEALREVTGNEQEGGRENEQRRGVG